jgi:hypothetical protein
MRKLLLVPLVLGVVVLAGCESTAEPISSPSERPSLAVGGMSAQASGGGHITYLAEIRTFAFNAQRDAAGNARGQVQINNRAQDRMSHGEVVCVGTFGSTAYIGVRVTGGDDETVIGSYGVITVIDNGEGASAPPDEISLLNFTSLPVLAPWCAGAYGNVLQMYPVERGNIQVR